MLLVFDYGYKGTTNFYTCKFFLTFFHFFIIFGNLTYNIGKFYLCALGCSLSGCVLGFVGVSVGAVYSGVQVLCWSWSCVLMTICLHHTHAHTYTRTHIRTRTGIFRP